jgi:tetratricopeptide (TPR) repeat protein
MNEYLVALFEQQWREDPRSRVFLRLAEEYRKGEQYEKAAEVCRKGIENHPDYVPALVCLGRCELALGNHDRAEQVFADVRERSPDNPHALRGLGHIYMETGRLGEAESLFEALALQDPSDAQIQEKLESLRHRAGEPTPELVPDEPEQPPPIQAEPMQAAPIPAEPMQAAPIPAAPVQAAPIPAEPIPANLKHETGDDEVEPELLLDEELADPDPPRVEEEMLEVPETDILPGSLEDDGLEAQFDQALRETDDDPSVLLAATAPGATANARKISALENWLEKIKGAHHV